MKTTILRLDSLGDVEIVLHSLQSRLTPAQVEEQIEDVSVQQNGVAGGEELIETVSNKCEKGLAPDRTFRDAQARGSKATEVRVQVSSSHLRLASPVFRQMLASICKETQRKGKGLGEVRLEGWDTNAFLTVLSIIHNRHRNTPENITLEALKSIADIVDHYQCHEAIELWVRPWLTSLSSQLPPSRDKNFGTWLYISWVFSERIIFKIASGTALLLSEESIMVPSASFPQKIVETKRVAIFRQTLHAIDRLCIFLKKESPCSFACSSMLLGSLMKYKEKLGLNELEEPFHGYSVLWFRDALSSIVTLPNRSCNISPLGCKLEYLIQPELQSIVEKSCGLELEIFR